MICDLRNFFALYGIGGAFKARGRSSRMQSMPLEKNIFLLLQLDKKQLERYKVRDGEQGWKENPVYSKYNITRPENIFKMDRLIEWTLNIYDFKGQE